MLNVFIGTLKKVRVWIKNDTTNWYHFIKIVYQSNTRMFFLFNRKNALHYPNVSRTHTSFMNVFFIDMHDRIVCHGL